MGRVVCVGDVMVDVSALLAGPLATGSDTPGSISVRDGGSGANTAAWLASLGVATTFVGCVGADAFGERAIAALAASGVAPAVRIETSLPTGMCIVLVGPDGERTMIPSAGANSTLAADDVLAALDGADHLHVSAYSLLREASAAAVSAALDAARRAGTAVSVDAASAAPLAAFGAMRFLGLVGRTLLFANADEAAVLTGLGDPSAAAAALAGHCGEAIVKAGTRGAVWSDGRDTCAVPAATARVVDSTGAGDAFAAGMLSARLDGSDIAACLAAGARTAALALAQVGARP